ncbi:DHH family phosphoesterase [Streptomyces clavuligerus]|uniref:DHH family phosphoesterase n=1 Tax=Streptomyces clavuligerus TaxID=1901 RepID=UPI00020D91D8|nr:DHH family phosphoesterase [Streptomyces clavuligerus]ANW20071.1 hypothetical protein BB341_18560 [Streptomyces clavuligerus]WDN52042.1 DHH family phosphoesterase [Streptomyces clavuligerus]
MPEPASHRPRGRARGARPAPARPAGDAPPGPSATARPGRRAAPGDPVGELVRWAAFGCLLVPVALVGYGYPAGDAMTAALGLAALTTACRAALRYAERRAGRGAHAAPGGAAPPPDPGRTGRTGRRTGPGGHHRRTRDTPARRRTGRHGGGRTPRD